MAKTLQEQIQEQTAKDNEQNIKNAGGGSLVTPAAAAAVGKNPDQAKMFGTKQQKSKALATAAGNAAQTKDVSQDDLLATVEGEMTFEDRAQDAASKKAQEYSEKYKEFGSLGNRIENVVKQQLSAENAVSLTGMEFDIDEDSLDSELNADISDEDRQTVYDTVNGFDEILSGNTGDATRDAELAAMSEEDRQKEAFDSIVGLSESGFFEDKEIGVVDTLKAAFKNNPQGLKDATAAAIANSVVDVEDLDIGFLMEQGMLDPEKDLGFTSEEMSSTFGDSWQTLTTDKIAAVMDNEFTQKHARADKLLGALKDPNTSPAIKQQLQRELEEMGVSGALQFEQLTKDTIEQVKDSGIIMFGGEPQDIKTLLDDEKIKADTKSLLNDPDSPESKKFREDNPQFAEYIDEAFADVEKSGETLGEAFDEFVSINKDNTELLATPVGGVVIADDFWAAMGFNDDLASTRIDPTTNALYAAMAGDSTLDGESVKTLQSLVTRGLLDENDLLNMDTGKLQSEMDKLDPKSKTGKAKQAEIDKITDHATSLVRLLATEGNRRIVENLVGLDDEWAKHEKAAGGTPASHTSNEPFYKEFFGDAGISNAGQVDAKLRNLRASVNMGVKGAREQYDKMSAVFDKDGDGKLDDAASVREAMAESIRNNSSLEDIIESNLSPSDGILGLRSPATTNTRIDRLLEMAPQGRDTDVGTLVAQINSEPNPLAGIDDLRKSGLLSDDKYKEITQAMIKKQNQDFSTEALTRTKDNSEFKSLQKGKDHLRRNTADMKKYADLVKKFPNRPDFKAQLARYSGKVKRNKEWINKSNKAFMSGPIGIAYKPLQDRLAELEKHKGSKGVSGGSASENMKNDLIRKMKNAMGAEAWYLLSGGK